MSTCPSRSVRRGHGPRLIGPGGARCRARPGPGRSWKASEYQRPEHHSNPWCSGRQEDRSSMHHPITHRGRTRAAISRPRLSRTDSGNQPHRATTLLGPRSSQLQESAVAVHRQGCRGGR